MESGLLQRCQDTELPLEVPAGALSQLQVHVLQPSVSQSEAQELKQVRPVLIYRACTKVAFFMFVFICILGSIILEAFGSFVN